MSAFGQIYNPERESSTVLKGDRWLIRTTISCLPNTHLHQLNVSMWTKDCRFDLGKEDYRIWRLIHRRHVCLSARTTFLTIDSLFPFAFTAHFPIGCYSSEERVPCSIYTPLVFVDEKKRNRRGTIKLASSMGLLALQREAGSSGTYLPCPLQVCSPLWEYKPITCAHTYIRQYITVHRSPRTKQQLMDACWEAAGCFITKILHKREILT